LYQAEKKARLEREEAKERAAQPQPEPEPREEERAPRAPHELKVPEWVDEKAITEAHQTWASDFAQVSSTAGIDATTAQDLLDFAADGAVHIGSHGIEVEHSTREEGQDAMNRIFGEKHASGLIENAQRYVKAHGGKDGPLGSWLTESGLGNTPEIITALAFAQVNYFKMSPARAQEGLDKIMQSPEFRRGDKLSVLKASALARSANRNSLSPEAQLDAIASRPQRSAAPAETEKVSVATARDKLSKMIGEKMRHGFSEADREEFMRLTKRISA
jgi:hypothetical protein